MVRFRVIALGLQQRKIANTQFGENQSVNVDFVQFYLLALTDSYN